MYRHSLRKRVAIAFALCVAVLSIVWGFAFFAAIRLSEDRVLTQQLQVAADNYPSLATNLNGYTEINDLPESLRKWALANPEEGLYEFDTEELHVAVISVDNEQQRAFVVFDVAGIEAASSEDWWLLLIILGVVGSLGCLGFVLGVQVMRVAIAPVAQLARAVENIDPQQLTADDHKRIVASRYGDDEVGLLAETIEKTLVRISAFVERERNFTSSASHELRTPVTILTGAIEILEQGNLSSSDARALDRIKRATIEMKTLIEMFLCLAREADDALYEEQFLVLPMIKNALEQQRYLLHGKSVDIDVIELANPKIYGHPPAFHIAVSNLVRNAFEHTHDNQSPIIIRVNQHNLLIINSFSHIRNHQHKQVDAMTQQGFGLGLNIVQRLCERNGWTFRFRIFKTCVVARLCW